MIRIAIIEDDKGYQEQLMSFIKHYGEEHNEQFQITLFEDGLDLIEDYKGEWDILLMDIKMKHMDGMSAAQKIRQYDSSVVIIFITTMAKFAIKGYEVDALDFVLKPIQYPQFAMKLKKAMRHLSKHEKKYLLLTIDDRKERVAADDILFVEVKDHKLQFVTAYKIYSMRYPLQEIEKELKPYHFVRCNHCYLVNLKNVKEVLKDSVVVGTHELQISRPKKKTFLQAVSDYFGRGYNL